MTKNIATTIFCFLFVLVVIFPSFSFCCGAPFPCGVWSDIAESESAFVNIPTNIGLWSGGLTGMAVGGVIGFSLDLVALPFMYFYDKGKSSGMLFYSGFMIGACTLGETTSFLVGAPFYVIEKVFWDFPNWILNSKDENE